MRHRDFYAPPPPTSKFPRPASFLSHRAPEIAGQPPRRNSAAPPNAGFHGRANRLRPSPAKDPHRVSCGTRFQPRPPAPGALASSLIWRTITSSPPQPQYTFGIPNPPPAANNQEPRTWNEPTIPLRKIRSPRGAKAQGFPSSEPTAFRKMGTGTTCDPVDVFLRSRSSALRSLRRGPGDFPLNCTDEQSRNPTHD